MYKTVYIGERDRKLGKSLYEHKAYLRNQRIDKSIMVEPCLSCPKFIKTTIWKRTDNPLKDEQLQENNVPNVKSDLSTRNDLPDAAVIEVVLLDDLILTSENVQLHLGTGGYVAVIEI